MKSPCKPTRGTATGAKCASSCDGVCNTAEIGCLHGLPEWQRHVERKSQSSSAQQLQGSGAQATEATRATGGEQCTRCAVGQGRECSCRSTFDRLVIRMVLIGLGFCWGTAIVLSLRGCAA
jgi:hypothetical protein